MPDKRLLSKLALFQFVRPRDRTGAIGQKQETRRVRDQIDNEIRRSCTEHRET